VIAGIGVDVVEVKRVEQAILRRGRRLLERVFTPAEIAYCERRRNRFERYAARFAAKEAAQKALGTGWSGGIGWRDFEITNLASGKPALKLSGAAARLARRMKVKRIALSLSHTRDLAIAQVILESSGTVK
jgi:holo-[acyl-carrier protein] synthase